MSFWKQEPPKPTEALRNFGPMPDGVRHLVDVRSRGLAQGGDRIDGRNALGEEGVGHKLGELGRPEIGSDDPFAGHPPGVNVDQFAHGRLAARRAFAADENAVGMAQILDRRALGEKLGIGKNLEVAVGRVRTENGQDGLCRLHRDGAFFHDDLRALCHAGDHARRILDVTQIGRPAGSHAVGFGRGSHADENDLSRADGLLDVGLEMEVAAACLPDNLV